MTLLLNLDLDVLKMCLCTKNEFFIGQAFQMNDSYHSNHGTNKL